MTLETFSDRNGGFGGPWNGPEKGMEPGRKAGQARYRTVPGPAGWLAADEIINAQFRWRIRPLKEVTVAAGAPQEGRALVALGWTADGRLLRWTGSSGHVKHAPSATH